VVVEFKSSKWR